MIPGGSLSSSDLTESSTNILAGHKIEPTGTFLEKELVGFLIQGRGLVCPGYKYCFTEVFTYI